MKVIIEFYLLQKRLRKGVLFYLSNIAGYNNSTKRMEQSIIKISTAAKVLYNA